MKHRRLFPVRGAVPRVVGVYLIIGVIVLGLAGIVLYSSAGDRDDVTTAGTEPRAAVAPAPSAPQRSVPGSAPAASPSSSRSSPAPSGRPSREQSSFAVPRGGCALPAYPTAGCTGVPQGWRPKTTKEGDLTITKAGTVLTDYLVTGTILVKAADVTIRRTRIYGGVDNFISDRIHGHLTIEDTEVVNPPGQEFSTNEQYAFGVANYTCRRCKVINRIEGWRIGANSFSGAGTVTIEDSFAQLAVPPGTCETVDPHGDGIQGYGAPTAVIRHNTIDQRRDDCPTSPIFIPDQDNAGGTVEDNLLAGGGYALRLTGGSFPSVTGNKIVEGSPVYGPVEVDCGKVGNWGDNAVVTYDWARGSIIKEKRKLDDCG
jgi:hypothetical protein